MRRGLSRCCGENRAAKNRASFPGIPPFINSDLRFYGARSKFLKAALRDVRRAIHSCDKKRYQMHRRSLYGTFLLLNQRRICRDTTGLLLRLFCILALPYLVLRKSSRLVVHMREFNVQSLGVNAILLSRILHFCPLIGIFCALLSCHYIICFTCCIS